MGLHTRIDETIQTVIQHAEVGKPYINRNMLVLLLVFNHLVVKVYLVQDRKLVVHFICSLNAKLFTIKYWQHHLL